MTRTWSFTDDGGLRFERLDDDGNVVEAVELKPTQSGQGEIAFTTADGETKRGGVEPGSASDKGLGQ
jgi:hypothetical protein